ncbi:low molecular weight protein-tyrosine-phosphatase [Terrilactibacillus laevilacticus]|uniref:protein-tyrosine-phosphatase n=1 Tax=Terrilactibacillus laevilacticus TaxID=1380157 RepID=A0ABW5PV08_9BACI|nr:low molecular weight protein-tyrosine-phosphatase [Terrilactibacillus laevilacticus]
MIKVLFVCLGNICRSPMAEAVFRDKVHHAGLNQKIEVDSAGTGDWHIGHPPHEGTRKKLDDIGISYEGMKGRQIRLQDFIDFDYIIAMDESNQRDIEDLMDHSGQAKVIRFMSLLEDKPSKSVPDPYYTGNFDEVYDLVNKGTEALLQMIIDEHLK